LSKESTSPCKPRRRWFRRLLIGAGAAVALGLLLILAVGWLEFSLRSIPEPEAVRRVAAERAMLDARRQVVANSGHGPTNATTATLENPAAERPRRPIGVDPRVPDGNENTPADFFIPRDQWGGWTLVIPEDYPTSSGLTLFPIHDDQTAEQRKAIQEFNELIRVCLAVLDDCRRPDNGRSYRENDALLHEVFRNQQSHFDAFVELFANEQRRYLGEPGKPFRPILDMEGYQACETIRDHWNDLGNEIVEAWVENAVRHENWMRAAHYSRDWDESVYYYRKVDGVAGYAELAGDFISRSYTRVRREHPLLERLLP
jgi:hypothetical protein